MNGPELAEAAKARLEGQIPSRPVYVGAPPVSPPARYLLVRTSEGSEESTRSTFTVNIQTPSLWVMSVSRNANPNRAADEASWGAARTREAMRGWAPDPSWAARSEASDPARRDESLPDTTFVAVEQFSRRSAV